jgi:single-strand DNA-binding protein
MIGINNVTILGNIGTISDVMSTTNGGKFVNITIATTESFYNSNKEKKTNTQWHNVILWNNMCELHKVISKGDLVYVEGRLNYRKKSENLIFTEIVAKNLRVLNKKNYDRNEKKDYSDMNDDFDYSGDDFLTRNFDNE